MSEDLAEAEGEGSGGRRFFLQERVGAGAFGEVFLAEQDSGAGFRRKVALKVLHPRQKGGDEAAMRMRDEARLLGRLSHRNIVTVLDLVRLDDRWAIVMEYVEGADLEHVLDALLKVGGSFPPAAALEVASAVADAIDAAFHADDGSGVQMHVVHRDIKPANVRITKDGDVKVLDFGVASMTLETREAMTGQYLMGTERYMAPERILGDDEGPPGDVYATAATIVELMLGSPLGRTPVLPDRHRKFLDDKLAELRAGLEGEVDPHTANAVIHLLRRALDDDPFQRPTAHEFSDQCARLARALPGEPLRAFARRFVPTCDDILGKSREVVSGVLSEITTIRALAAATGELEAPSEARPIGEPTESRRRGGAGLLVGAGAAVVVVAAAVVLLVVGLGIGLVVVLNQPSGTDHVASLTPDPTPPQPIAVVAPTPTPSPVVEPAEPEANGSASADTEAALAPVVVAPTPVKRTPVRTPVKPPPVAPPPEPVTAPEPVASGPPVSRALVLMTDASSITVTCGAVTARGTASARIADFPSGTCKVSTVHGGLQRSTTVDITRPREVTCEASGDKLKCN